MDSVSGFSERVSQKLEKWVDNIKMTEHIFMIVLAILTGVLAGFGAVGIRALITAISDLSFSGNGSLLDRIIEAPWYVKILVPTIGGLIVGPIIYKFAPEAKGHGVPEVMQAILLKSGHIRPRVAFIKALASSITIGTGGSVGREGPIIQIGASIGSTIGQLFKVRTQRLKTLVGCGAAAGIAAAFNAPVAGALFAIEIILMDFAVAQFTPIVISSVIATVISHQFEGNFPAFPVPAYHLESPYEIIFYFGLGILSGVVSWMFIKVLYFFEDLWDEKFKFPEYLKATVGGLMVGGIALLYPQIMGVGYDSITMALNSNVIWSLALVLIFVKILATSLTLGSGGSGGIFAPSLFMGAMLGAFFGYFVHQAFPNITADYGAYAIVAMGGLVAGTTRAPITAIIIVFEMTKDYSIILPLMIVCTLSMILSAKLSRESIYTLKLVNRKINIRERAEVNIMKSLSVKDVMSKEFSPICEDTNFTEVVSLIVSRRLPYISVKSRTGSFMGIISINDIKELLFDKDALQFLIIAGDIVNPKIERTTPDMNCRQVLEIMNRIDSDVLPVVDTDDNNKQIGLIWRKDIDDTYHKEIDRIELTSDLADKITLNNSSKDITFLEGYVITEIPVPNSFIGRSIRELGIRSKFGVDVLTIKKKSNSGEEIKAIPQANYTFTENDLLIVAGEKEKINILKGYA